jgi:FkbM family methyltransferase
MQHVDRPHRLKIEDGLALWRTSAGEYWTSESFHEENIRIGSNEIAVDIYGTADLPRGAVVLDCGANVGMFSDHVLQRPDTRVIAFEPTPLTVRALRRNLLRHGDRATVIERGVWDKSERLFLQTYDENPAANTVGSAGDLAIDVVSIDEVVSQLGLTRLDYIKLDVEGAETRALMGAAETIRRFRPVLAIGTEHTEDVTRNVESVIAAVESIDPSYRMKCRECRLYRSLSHGSVATPHVVRFVSHQ